MDKKIIAIGIGSVAGVLLIGGGVWYVMMRVTPNENLPQENITQEIPIENGEDVLKKILAEREILLSQSDDKDGDGLTDSEEIKLGTNPQKIDTDNDGLTDHFEVNVLKTDPKRIDSDGDGISDWNEDYQRTSEE